MKLTRTLPAVAQRSALALAVSAAFSYGGGFWLHLLHSAATGGSLAAWLRDATMLLPAAALGVALGWLLARRTAPGSGLLSLALMAVFASLSSAAAGPLYAMTAGAILAPAQAESLFLCAVAGVDAAGAAFAPAALVSDLLLLLPANLLIGALGALLLALPGRAVALARAAGRLNTAANRRRALGAGVLGVVALSPFAGLLTATPAAAATLAPAQCDATTAARGYDVVAINVRIPYNRWGDHDPNGMMFALAGDESAYKNWWQPLDPNAANPLDNRRLRPRPLVLRANAGECVKVTLTNKLDERQWGGKLLNPRVSMNAIGVAYSAGTSDGGNVGYNPDTTVGRGESVTYYWLAPQKEGMYHFRDTAAVTGSEADAGSMAHGLFGALAVEPAGSRWYDAVTGKELYTQTGDVSGDLYIDAIIVPPSGESFRETVQLSQDEIPTVNKDGVSAPSFGFNFGAEPEHNRDANRCPDCVGEETSLSSWVYGDPAAVKLASGTGPWLPSWQEGGEADPEDCGIGTPGFDADSCWTANVTRAYRWDRYKLRFGMATSYETHIFHLHANQWRPQPDDPESTIIDSQTFGPGDAFTADLIGGAGSVAGTVGDSIFHCHLYPHFAEGFWALLRVHDALEDGTKVNPDGIKVAALAPLPQGGNLEGYVPQTEEQLGRPGFPRFIPGEFGWRAPQPPLGISEQSGQADDPATMAREDLRPGVRMVAGKALEAGVEGYVVDPGVAAKVAAEQAAMEAIYAESAALGGEFQRGAPKPGAPFADPCPAGTREVTYNVSIIQAPVVYNKAGWFDSQARFLVLDAHVDDIMAGRRPAEPMFMRVNQGDCVNFNLTNRLPNWFGNDAFVQLAQTNMMGGHIHLVKFDVLASDGSSNGWNYQQAAFTQLQTTFKNNVLAGTQKCDADEATSACRIPMIDPSTYSPATTGLWPGQTLHERWYADSELRTIFTHDHHFAALDQNRGQFGALLVEPRGMDFRHPNTGQFFQPINQAANGPVCGQACIGNAVGTKMDIIGPGPGDDFREFGLAIQDFVALHRPAARGNPARLQDPAYAINAPESPELFPKHDPGTFAVNYRNSPLQERRVKNGQPVDPAYVFSSYVWGDPETPLLEAYAGDPVQFRLIQGSQEEQHTLTIHGVKWRQEPEDPFSQFVNSVTIGISEAFNAKVPPMSCGWDEDCQGDYLYTMGATDGVYQGVWGIFRVYGRNRNGLLPLPDTQPQNMQGNVTFKTTGAPPPPAKGPGTPCVPGSPVKRFTVVAHDAPIVYNEYGHQDPYGLLYTAVRPGETLEQAMARNAADPAPMVLRANEGDCIEVTLHNRISRSWLDQHGSLGVRDGDFNIATEPAEGTPAGLRVSLHASLVQYDVRGSDGATVGYNRDQTVGPGESILYRWYAEDVTPGELGAITLLEYGDVRGHRHHGMLAGLVIGPKGATYHDPITGAEVSDGAYVDVRVPGQPDWRDLAVFYQDGLNLRYPDGSFVREPEDLGAHAEPGAGEETAPNPLHPAGEGADENIGEKGFNYGSEPLYERLGRHAVHADADNPLDGRALADLFSSWVHGDPATPILRAYAGDPVRVRLMQHGDRPRQHVFGIGGHGWLDDPWDPQSRYTGGLNGVSTVRAFNLHLPSAGSALQGVGDYRYGSLERNHFESRGLWGIFRVYGQPPAAPAHVPSAIAAQDTPYAPGAHPLMPLELATVTASIYEDMNQNAARGQGEGGLAGVTVNLRAGGSVVATGTTDAAGAVSFHVRPGLYDVETVAGAGLASTSPVLLRADVQAENSRTTVAFGLVRLAALRATLINDRDGDGQPGTGEAPLAGWTVRLVQGSTTIATAVSDGAGQVSFGSLRPGSYKLSAVAPGGWFATVANPLTVSMEGVDMVATLGFAARAGLSVAIFNDANQTGAQDSGERNLADWRVTIAGGPADLPPVAVTGRTGTNGAITFDHPDTAIDGLLPGRYSVTIAAPRGWSCVGTGVVTYAGTAGATSGCSDHSFTTELLAGTSQVVRLAYYTPNHWVVAEPFNDLNRNGARESGEGKLIGWTARLTDANGKLLGEALTGNDGRVTWTITPAMGAAQPYSVALTAPPPAAGSIPFEATAPALRQLRVAAGDIGTAQVGFAQVSTVGVRVFEDHDQDGVWDTHEGPLANRNVVFYDRTNKTVIGTAVTDALGMAAFKMTAGRTYYLEVVLPTAWRRTAPLTTSGTAITRLQVVAPSNGASLEVLFGQYNTVDTTPPPAPVLNTNPGSYDQAVGVTVESETGAQFRYTLDGAAPTATTGYPLIDPMITIAARGATRLTVVAIDRAGNVSAPTVGDFSITYAGEPVEQTFVTSVKDWRVLKGGIAAGYAHWMAYVGDGLQMTPRSSRLWDGAQWMHMAEGYGTLTLPAGQRSLTGIQVSLTDKVSRTGIEQYISLYNYRTGAWDNVGGPQLRTTTDYQTLTAAAEGTLLDYVDATTGEVRVRVASFLRTNTFTNSIDQLTVRVRYTP